MIISVFSSFLVTSSMHTGRASPPSLKSFGKNMTIFIFIITGFDERRKFADGWRIISDESKRFFGVVTTFF